MADKSLKNREILRNSVLQFLMEEVEGPRDEEEYLRESPLSSYITGVLYPQGIKYSQVDSPEPDNDELDEDETEPISEKPTDSTMHKSIDIADSDEDTASETTTQYEESIRLANNLRPSAIGMSFLCAPPQRRLLVKVSAARYHRTSNTPSGSSGNRWKREKVKAEPKIITLPLDQENAILEINKIADNLEIQGIARKRKGNDYLVTLTLLNTQKEHPNPENCFFQVSFSVEDPSGVPIFNRYESGKHLLGVSEDKEVQSMALLYRRQPKFAIGHGCATDWTRDVETDCALSIRTSNIPVHTISPIMPTSAENKALRNTLSMEFLGQMKQNSSKILDDDNLPHDWDVVLGELLQLPVLYEQWIEKKEEELLKLDARYQEAGRDNLDNCKFASGRIREGIKLLAEYPTAAKAFCLMNRVMLMQQIHYGLSSSDSRDDDNGIMHLDYHSNWEERKGFWRRFQLAFILMSIPAFVPDTDSELDHRDIADLIWFPTGGGKTEAYLGLAAFCIFMRRLIRSNNAGCTVLMRYTLRLLTSQQFQRASSMICACEYIRRRTQNTLGEEPISIGLWIGGDPRSRQSAVSLLKKFSESASYENADNPFQILNCPWCGAKMDRGPRFGYRQTAPPPKTVIFRCPNTECEFSGPSRQDYLPISIIDEEIYEIPPTLLLGTVDKFANLAWKEECSALFGLEGNHDNDPPDLIIQDELHLISGPLGSMVGLYESVIDLLCIESGHKSKIIASTATIRRADEQCSALYNRKRTFLFPPQGLDIEDSFYAKVDETVSGRMYVGILPTAASSPQTALRWVSGALLQAAKSVSLPSGMNEANRDPYWTLVQYFSSLRELGSAKTIARSDIPEHIQYISRERNLNKEESRNAYQVEEMTGRRSRGELNRLLKRLNYPHLGDNIEDIDETPLDILLATNMISVGVDIPRLGLMTVVGQPKTTSEYIQSTSRVGRDLKAPGLIIMLYNAAKTRDRSHYEDFRDYHQAFYSHVEPTSVTPFSIPAMDRALHALIFIVVRHIDHLKSAQGFRSDLRSVRVLRHWLSNRVADIDKSHQKVMLDMFDAIVVKWENHRERYIGGRGGWGIPYMNDNARPEDPPLMYPSGRKPDERWGSISWEVPQSLRSVDVECECEIRADYPLRNK